MGILPYECGVEEEGREVCRRLRGAGLHEEADWVEVRVEGVDSIRSESQVIRAVNEELEWEILRCRSENEDMQDEIERLERELKAAKGG